MKPAIMIYAEAPFHNGNKNLKKKLKSLEA
jgi:hypothetical protein